MNLSTLNSSTPLGWNALSKTSAISGVTGVFIRLSPGDVSNARIGVGEVILVILGTLVWIGTLSTLFLGENTEPLISWGKQFQLWHA